MAERSGFSVSQLSRWEAGASNIPSERLPALAAAYECRIADIFEEDDSPFQALGPKLYVKGEVAAGVWKEAWQWDPPHWETFTGTDNVTVPLEGRFGLRVCGDSMNDLYPHGSIVECVSLMRGAELESGKRVIVQRQRDDGEYELTVKEYLEDESGRPWLWPRSNRPEFQTPFPLDDPETGIGEVSIVAVVISSVRPE